MGICGQASKKIKIIMNIKNQIILNQTRKQIKKLFKINRKQKLKLNPISQNI